MEEKIPLKTVLSATIEQLSGISIPVWLMDQIGDPIRIAVRNLDECVKAIPDPPEAPDPETEEKAIREEDI